MTRVSTNVRPLLAIFLALGCGSPARPEPPPTSSQEPVVSPAQPSPTVEIHEWGLIDVDVASGVAEISAGPGQPARPVVARKPILYFHLLEGDTATLRVSARVPGGAILEHWPPGELTGDSIAWNVNVRRGPCGDTTEQRTPTRRGPQARACDAPDGFCEVHELPRYVTTDHDCLDANGAQASLLFYRASARADALPLQVTRSSAMELAITANADPANAPRTMLRISTAMAGRWQAGRFVVARAQRPARGQTATIALGQAELDPASEREAMTRTLGELGLTPSEAQAFVEAWATELFGAGAQRDATVLRQDVLLYWLSPDDVSRLSIIDAGPAPVSLRRAFLVRVTLPAVLTD